VIIYRDGNLLDSTDDCWAHQVNCKGVMGAGVAKAISDKFPEVKERYMEIHRSSGWKLGMCCGVFVGNPKVIFNMAAQEDYGRSQNTLRTNYEALRKCFGTAFTFMDKFYLRTLSIPRIGCGLAGGDWNIVENLIKEELEPYGITVTVWTP
jgi:O-acetyl-ADP-ribose deacetylase (regulator of RNase III)